jgi:GAF domain-containing protein
MTSVSTARLATMFVEVADTLVDEFDLVDFLHMIAQHAVTLVDAAAAGMMLAEPGGELKFVAGSDESARLVEFYQLQVLEGPCLEAFRTGASIVNVNLASAGDRWPLFAPEATAAGFDTVHAFPLRLRSEVIGALNVFGRRLGAELAASDVPILEALADVATIGLVQERAIRRGGILVEQLQGALHSRIAIEQAKGVLAQANGISVDEAFALIRSYARNHNRRLTDLARTVVTDLESLPELARPRGASRLSPADG